MFGVGVGRGPGYELWAHSGELIWRDTGEISASAWRETVCGPLQAGFRPRVGQAASSCGVHALCRDMARMDLSGRTVVRCVEVGRRSGGDRVEIGRRSGGDRVEIGRRSCGDRVEIVRRSGGDRVEIGWRSGGDRAEIGWRSGGDRVEIGWKSNRAHSGRVVECGWQLAALCCEVRGTGEKGDCGRSMYAVQLHYPIAMS